MSDIAVAEFEDYESLPTHSLWIHMVAGAAAGVMEHCTMYPMDVVKTRMQSVSRLSPDRNVRSPLRGLLQIIQREGYTRVTRGVGAVAFGAVPAHALYFTVYEKLKLRLLSTRGFSSDTKLHPIAHGVAGVAATVAHDAVMNPAEVVKQRMQMFCCPYRGTFECARCIFNAEGIMAFYRSYPVQLLMNIPFHTSHFIVYEFCQSHLNPTKRYHPVSHLVSGGLAGGLAAAITTPLDVCKTLLNTQEAMYTQQMPPSPESKASSCAAAGSANCARTATTGQQTSGARAAPSPSVAARLGNVLTSARSTYSFSSHHTPSPGPELKTAAVVRGMSAAYREILASKGWRGLFSGIQARVLFQVPGTAIAWSVYELFKFLLREERC